MTPKKNRAIVQKLVMLLVKFKGSIQKVWTLKAYETL